MEIEKEKYEERGIGHMEIFVEDIVVAALVPRSVLGNEDKSLLVVLPDLPEAASTPCHRRNRKSLLLRTIVLHITDFGEDITGSQKAHLDYSLIPMSEPKWSTRALKSCIIFSIVL